MNTHDLDFYTWTQEQARYLRTKQINLIDWENVAEEIEDMGRSEKRQLESRLEVLIMHLLKWQYQPNLRSRSWSLTLKEQRLRIEKLLQENPSLRPKLDEAIDRVYPLAAIAAEREAGLSVFPPSCPYTLEEILSSNFAPD
jgi:hypothetical protein